MKKIEEVTCIKFEDRSKTNHKELVQLIVTKKYKPRLLINHLTHEYSWFSLNLKKDYIEFRDGNGCRSLVGRAGQKQEIILIKYCAEEHTLIHEVHLFIKGIFK